MSTYQYQAPRAPKRRHGKLIAGLVALVLCAAGGTLFALVAGAIDPNTPSPGRALAATSTASPTGTAAAAAPADSPDAGGADLTARNITLRVKITSQKCFGSAGCNVELEVRAGWPDGYAGDWDVTYTVAIPGGDDVTDTLTIYAETGKYDAASTAFVSTSHRVNNLKAKINSVEAA